MLNMENSSLVFPFDLTGLSIENITAILNFYNYSFDDENTWSEENTNDIRFHIYLYQIIVPILFGLIIAVGLVGNILVICVIVSKKKMRTILNLLLLNLASSDIIFCCICIPFVSYHYAADSWTIGPLMCKLSQYLIYVCVYVTTSTLVCIAVFRFMTIVHPVSSQTFRTKKNILIIVVAIWIFNLLFNIPILLIYRVNVFHIDISIEPYYYCGMANKAIGQKIFLVFFVLTYIIPLVSITILYILITRYLHKAREQAMKLKRNSSTSTIRTKKAQMSHATRLLFIVCTIFAVCWFPLHLHLLMSYFGLNPATKVYEVFRVLCHCLAYSNCCMNPIIYNYASKDFRKNFRLVLASWLCCDCSFWMGRSLAQGCQMRIMRRGTTTNTAQSTRNDSTLFRASLY